MQAELGIPSEEFSDGYPALATFIARDPDGETFIFRKFAGLTARRLLQLESELIELEDKPRSQSRNERGSGRTTVSTLLRRGHE